jgi:two-component system sensor histidine kinase YesM
MKPMTILFQRIRFHTNRSTVRKRWLLMLVFFVIIPSVLIVSLFLQSVLLENESEAKKYGIQSVTKLRQSLEYRMNSIAILSDSILLSIYETISPVTTNRSAQYDEYQTLNHFFNNYVNQEIVDSIRLYVPDSKFYSRQKDRFFPLSMLENSVSNRLLQNSAHRLWIGNYNRTRYYSNEQQRVFTYVTALRSASDYESLQSVMYVDILEQEICAILNDETASSVYLIDENNLILSAHDKHLIDGSVFDALCSWDFTPGDDGSLFVSHDGERQLISWSLLENVPWRVVRVAPFSSNYGSFRGTITLIALLILLALAFLLISSWVLDNTILRLNRTMNSLREHGLGFLGKHDTNVGTLSLFESNVEDMVNTIRSLVEEAYEARLASRSAELKALQAQINPHFLYNTLDALKYLILDGDTHASEVMINDLSDYFRLSLNKGQDIVPLRDEYNLVKAYLSIQSCRFADEFVVDWQIDEDALSVNISLINLALGVLRHLMSSTLCYVQSKKLIPT